MSPHPVSREGPVLEQSRSIKRTLRNVWQWKAFWSVWLLSVNSNRFAFLEESHAGRALTGTDSKISTCTVLAKIPTCQATAPGRAKERLRQPERQLAALRLLTHFLQIAAQAPELRRGKGKRVSLRGLRCTTRAGWDWKHPPLALHHRSEHTASGIVGHLSLGWPTTPSICS